MEKRKEFRMHKRVLVRFTHLNNTHFSFTGDISPRGLFIQTPYVYPPGDELALALLHVEKEIPLNGRIAWNKQTPVSSFLLLNGGMGVQLTGPDCGDFLRLLQERPT